MTSSTSIGNAPKLGPASAAFALSASATFIFNTLLAWVKDSVPALNTFMASLTGHHWTTHSIFDLIVFVGLGFIFMKTGTAQRMDGMTLVRVVIGSAIISGLGLLGWFFFT